MGLTKSGDERIPFGLLHLVVQYQRRKIQPEASASGLVALTRLEVPVRDTITVIHRNGLGFPDYVIVLTFEYSEESGKWVGVCLELGTSAFADALERVREELHEAVELQLNEMERLGHVQDFLEENHVRIVQIGPGATPREAGFAVATITR